MTTRTVRLHAMAMAFDVTADLEDDAPLAAFAAELTHADDTFSLFRPDTPMARIAAGDLSARDAPGVAEVLELCEHYRELTGGAFDARRPDGVVDPTGIVKSWATTRAVAHLGEVERWLVAASGDVVARGGDWVVGIADPAVRGDPAGAPVLDAIALGGEFTAVATSGSAHRGDHIWDPVTGEPARHYVQASVAGRDLVACDAWATAICAGGAPAVEGAVEAGLEVLIVTGVRSQGGYHAVASEGWPRVIGHAPGVLAQ